MGGKVGRGYKLPGGSWVGGGWFRGSRVVGSEGAGWLVQREQGGWVRVSRVAGELVAREWLGQGVIWVKGS